MADLPSCCGNETARLSLVWLSHLAPCGIVTVLQQVIPGAPLGKVPAQVRVSKSLSHGTVPGLDQWIGKLATFLGILDKVGVLAQALVCGPGPSSRGRLVHGNKAIVDLSNHGTNRLELGLGQIRNHIVFASFTVQLENVHDNRHRRRLRMAQDGR